MQQFKKLAIAGAVSTLMMSASVAQAHVSYNTAPSKNDNAASGTAVWTDGAATNYTGSLPVNWVANVHNMTDPNVSYEVSTADADVSGFTIKSMNNKWNPASSWGAALGYGLIDMHATGNLTIEVEADSTSGSIFTPGFTLFSGWDTGAGNKHQAWNADPSNPVSPFHATKNPTNTMLGTTGLTYEGHSATTTPGGTTALTFYGLAAGEYTLLIGGNSSGSTSGTNQQYIANITASPVPVPAAAWLMGSAILGLAGMRRKTA